MTLIANVFPKLETRKNVVRYMSKKSRFKGPFERQHGKRAKTHFRSKRQHRYLIYWSFWIGMSRKKPLLVRCKTLEVFVNTLTADDKYSLLNRDNLKEPIHTQLSQKPKTFCESFFEFSKSTLNFKHLRKKDDSDS